MTQPAPLSVPIEALRQRTLAGLRRLTEGARAFELPEPPPGLELLQRKLDDNSYQVLVVGEAKRGKSTFINALMGRSVLPTDVDIATSQIFRINPAEREAYRIRFEDESQQPITLADLPKYGSQVVADSEGVPRLDQIIRWIEVDAPVSPRIWPGNVRILDTPGLGALYAAHAQITYRFVPHADAVIFVLESQAPISEPELKFIATILEVTGNIFFIQSGDVREFTRKYELAPKTDRDLFRIVKNRLNEIRHDVELSDNSLREEVPAHCDEYVLRRWLARKLAERSRQRYTIPQEEEIDQEVRPDLRAENPRTNPVSIEIKWAENWTVAELLTGLEQQLVGKYLRAHGSRNGIYVLGYQGGKVHWKLDDSRLLTFVEVLELVLNRAEQIPTKNGGVEQLCVIGIDFTVPPKGKKTQSTSARDAR